MVAALSVARPYANALFELALNQDALTEWQQILQQLSLISEDPQIQQLLKNPRMQPQLWQQLLLDLLPKAMLEKKPHLSEQVSNFINLIIHHRRLDAISAIYQQFQQRLAVKEQMINLEVSTPFELGDKERGMLLTALQKQFNATEIAVKYHIDDSLMGGVVIRNGNWVLDGSVKGKLQRLQHYITQ